MTHSNFIKSIVCFFILFSLQASFAQTTTFTYIHPLDGSENLNPEQNIILKHGAGFNSKSIDNTLISIVGTQSGSCEANIFLSKDDKTLVLTPINPFRIGEVVTVSIPYGIQTLSDEKINSKTFSFSIINYDRTEIQSRLIELAEPAKMPLARNSGRSYNPNIDDNNLPPFYPAPEVISYGPHDNEYIFLSLNNQNITQPWENYLTIIDSYGIPIYYEKTEINKINFHVLPNGYLSYAWNFFVNNENEKYFIMDSSFSIIDSVKTGNGYYLDAHDMVLNENGNYLVMSYDPQPVDMSLIVAGGNPEAIVTGLIIQEVNSNQTVTFQWRSWDHFQITDATYDINLTAPTVDYVHGNALCIDNDGHILLSSRNMDEITKINIDNGEIIWRFGLNCENNMFTIEGDPVGFSHQHDIRLLPNGYYSIYDNGNNHNPQFTQALIYDINGNTLNASRLWSYQHNPQVYAGSMGSFRAKVNGDKIIGWGGYYPLVTTELKSDNSLLREYFVPDWVLSYRSIKNSWETNLFETQEELSMGNCAGYAGWKGNYLFIHNTSNQIIKITSVHNHLDEIEIDANFPISIFPGSYNKITVKIQATGEESYSDRLTLNYDNEGNTKRIARQLSIVGILNSEQPSVFFDPPHGTENVSPLLNIRVNFSEAVRKAIGGEISNSNIPSFFDFKEEAYFGTDISFSGIINEEKTVITLIPDQPLSENQQYYLKLKGNVLSDYEGNLISLDEESYFKTGLILDIKPTDQSVIAISPNPFTDNLLVRTNNNEAKSLTVYSSSGNIVFTKNFTESSTSVNLAGYPAGIYFIKLTPSEGRNPFIVKAIKR